MPFVFCLLLILSDVASLLGVLIFKKYERDKKNVYGLVHKR